MGPAGAGKTTTLAALRAAWEGEHGPGSVVGLAPSATAAAVLANELGITTENTAKWLSDHQRTGNSFNPGQLVIVDEASLAGTFSLAQIAGLAAQTGAKLLLVGDHAQLQAVNAGGAFALLVAEREQSTTPAPELQDVFRFRADWEKAASIGLRHGNPDVIVEYAAHQRITGGEAEAMADAAYTAWQRDTAAGKQSLLIVDNRAAVTALNQRARTDRLAGVANNLGMEVVLADGSRASRGDAVITRLNDRRLIAGATGWVRNGDRWTITRVNDDGSAIVRRAGMTTGGSVTLPAAYVAASLDLGYAVTAHRAQGVTVDTAHTVVTATTTRENLYVAMTRGRDANHAYVTTENPLAAEIGGLSQEIPAEVVLAEVLANTGVEFSAHQAREAEHEKWGSISQLGAEYETLAATALRDYWQHTIRASFTGPQAEAAISSEHYDALAASMTGMWVRGWDVEHAFPRLAAARDIPVYADPADVMNQRLARMAQSRAIRPQRGGVPTFLGTFPVIPPSMTIPAIAAALAQRRAALTERAEVLLARAQQQRAPWLRELGPRPVRGQRADQWPHTARAIAAHRERHDITGKAALGSPIERSRATANQRQATRNLEPLIRAINPPAPTWHHTEPTRTLDRGGPVLSL